MKNFLISITAATLLVGCSNAAESAVDSGAEASGAAQSSGSQPLRGNQDSRFIQVMERSIEASMLLYVRMVPEGEARLQPISFDGDDHEVFRCVIREMRSAGFGSYIDDATRLNLRLAEYIESNPELTLQLLVEDQEFQAITDELNGLADGRLAGMASINSECGVMQLTSEKLEESGATSLLMEAMTQADE